MIMFEFENFSIFRSSSFRHVISLFDNFFIIHDVRMNDFFINDFFRNSFLFNDDFVFFKFFTSHNTIVWFRNNVFVNKQIKIKKFNQHFRRNHLFLILKKSNIVVVWTFDTQIEFQIWWNQIEYDIKIHDKFLKIFRDFKWNKKKVDTKNLKWRNFWQIVLFENESSKILCKICDDLLKHFTFNTKFNVINMKKHLNNKNCSSKIDIISVFVNQFKFNTKSFISIRIIIISKNDAKKWCKINCYQTQNSTIFFFVESKNFRRFIKTNRFWF